MWQHQEPLRTKLFRGVEGKKEQKEEIFESSICRLKLNRLALFQVFDATNTTSERREVILGFAKENGYKVPCCPMKTSA